MSQQINLFNPIFLKQKKHFSARTMLQGLALIAAGSVLVAVYARVQLAALESQVQAGSVQLAQTKAQLAKVSADYPPRQKNRALADEIQQVTAELAERRQVFATMQRGDFGNNDGYAEYMRAFARQIVDGLWLTGFTVRGAGSDIELRGRTLQPELVPVYISRLSQEKSMRGKSFANLTMTMKEGDKPQSVGEQEVKTPLASAAPFIEFALRSSDAPASGEASKATVQRGMVLR